MSQPFNLDALVIEQESDEPFRFTWGGEEYSIPRLHQLPLKQQMELLRAENPIDQVELLFSREGLDRLANAQGAGGKQMTMARLAELLKAYMAGQEPGKSPASSSSSTSTAPRSKPTSRSGRGRKTS